jgi:hypothetical protein
VSLKAALDAQGAPAVADATAHRLRGLVTFLARFGSRADVDAELRRLGFEVAAPPGKHPPLDVREVLHRNGQLVEFDPETDQWPNEHDHLARQFAHAIGEDLNGVLFEEVAAEAGPDPYVLRAYVDGVVLETEAQAKGDWYDVDAVLGLVNRVLERRRSERRVALVFASGNDATVVAGPSHAIRELHTAGLLDLVEHGSAKVDAARESERKAIRDMGYTPLE